MRGFRPLGSRILVRMGEEERESEGGIIYPGSCVEGSCEGEVISVGGGVVDVVVGDLVVLRSYQGSVVDLGDGCEYRVVDEGDVVCLLEGVG